MNISKQWNEKQLSCTQTVIVVLQTAAWIHSTRSCIPLENATSFWEDCSFPQQRRIAQSSMRLWGTEKRLNVSEVFCFRVKTLLTLSHRNHPWSINDSYYYCMFIWSNEEAQGSDSKANNRLPFKGKWQKVSLTSVFFFWYTIKIHHCLMIQARVCVHMPWLF